MDRLYTSRGTPRLPVPCPKNMTAVILTDLRSLASSALYWTWQSLHADGVHEPHRVGGMVCVVRHGDNLEDGEIRKTLRQEG